MKIGSVCMVLLGRTGGFEMVSGHQSSVSAQELQWVLTAGQGSGLHRAFSAHRDRLHLGLFQTQLGKNWQM